MKRNQHHLYAVKYKRMSVELAQWFYRRSNRSISAGREHAALGSDEYEENFAICQQFVISNLKYHRFLSVDSHKVTRQLDGVCEKLKIHSESKKASKLQALSEEFLETAVYEGKDVGKTDTHYSVLLFLLLISNDPIHSDYVETEKVTAQDMKDDIDWGAYLLEGIQRYDPSDGELSDWTDDDDDSEEEKYVRRTARDNSQSFDERQTVAPYIVSDSSTVHEEEPGDVEDCDWLSRNLIAQYWKGEKVEVETGKYRSCQLNNNWEAYKERIDPLSCDRNKVVVTENVLLREVIWMLMGISNLYLLEFNGRFFVPKRDISVPHLSEESLHNCLTQFTRYGAYIQILQNFVEECNHGNRSDICQTYQSFASTVADFLQDVKTQLSILEQKLIKQEEVLTLLTVARDTEPLMQKVGIVCLVYMRGIHQGRPYKLASQKATLLLTTLYNTLLSCDTLFETPLFDEGGVDLNQGQNCDTTDMLKLLLPMWIQTCQPYINIIDTWISHGYLTDPHSEFIIQRNKEIDTLDETFWEKSFAFHTMVKDPDTSGSGSDKRVQEYDTMDWAPKFLQPVLQQIVLTGKSMEMLEGLGKLAEYDGKGFSNHLNEFKETHLYDKFITSLQTLLGTKTKSDSGEETRGTTQNEPVFSPDIERQMKEKGIHDSFLKMHFEKIMQQDTEYHSILEENFSQKMHSLNLDNLQPVELILQECLYPHIYKQYGKVCLKLVDTLKTEYHLMDYLKAMRRFFLMEAGDTMFIFYTEIFDKIRLHEHWKDTTTVTWALHEALDRHFPDEVTRIAVFVDTSEDDRDSQPINVTNCLKLQYQIPSPVDVVINERCQEIYNHIFSFLLQVKRAKYCLDELRFYDLAKECASSTTDRLLKSLSLDKEPRSARIHRMHLLRMKLINFVNSLHNYIMTRILHSIGLEFTHDLKEAKDLDQIIEIHAGYIRKIHERCLLHKKNTFLKEAVLKVLNLSLRFQKEWDCGIDNISMKQIEDTEMEFSRCIQFLRSFLNSVIQRGSFPHLESLAFGLENLIPR
ncbi:gamma-tubulin complex component 5-like isoform X3 [Mercenaria mercenaria]|uniref:gamma-tubulin complex component 5-like isoform X3 n=1 Tax=Mercenaria mercenaria TaxID=6596 RepID=UPI00234F82F0|nr:gamma-tubulin complex component 5-like isoform X3 [Mercenaria mercenaria]